MPKFSPSGAIADRMRPWFDATRTIYQTGSDSGGWRIVLSDGTLMHQSGANTIAAGGGKWVGQLSDGPIFGSITRSGGIAANCVGQDGTIVYKADFHRGGPWHFADGSLLTKDDAQGIFVRDRAHIAWTLPDKTLRANFPIVADRGFWPTPTPEGDLLYQRMDDSLALNGRVIAPRGAYFCPDIRRVSDGWEIVYSRTSADVDPQRLRITRAQWDAAPSIDADEPEPDKPVDPLDPVKPEEPKMPWTRKMPDRTDVVQRLKDQYPDEWKAMNSGPDLRFIKRLAWTLHQIDPNFGLNGKRGNTHDLSEDCVAYKNPTVDNGPEVADVVIAHMTPDARPGWINITKDSQGWNADGQQERHDDGSINGGAGAIWVDPGEDEDGTAEPPIGPVKPPDSQPKDPRVAPMISSLQVVVSQLKSLPVVEQKECTRPHDPVCDKPHDSPKHPSYDDMMRLMGETGLSTKAAHIVWRYLIEGYSHEDLVREARS